MKALLAALALAAAAAAAPTHVVGTLRAVADPTPINGYVLITWQTFTATDNTIYPSKTTRLQITSGRFDAYLEPGSYTLAWGNIGNVEVRTLTVPASAAIVALAACITTTPQDALQQFSLQQLSPSGAALGQALIYTAQGWAPVDLIANATVPISGVPGLQSALDLRATIAQLTAAAAAAASATTAEAAARTASDAAEATTRAAADTTHAAALAAETTARQADTAAIAAESSARAAADTANAAALASEASTRTAADASNAAAIAAEATARAAAIAASAPRTYTESFSDALTVTIPASLHLFATPELTVSCRDTAGAAYENSVTIDPATYTVTIQHATPQTGYCTVRR